MVNEEMQGLTAAQVEHSRLEHGENVLTPPERLPMWRLYLEKYDDPMVRILLVAALISLVLAIVRNDYLETLGILAAIILATTVGFYFERDAARKFGVLTRMGEEQPVKVVRDGRLREIPRRAVVVGDVVRIEAGDEVPADGTLLSSVDLEVDESGLTGEPLTTKAAAPSAVSAAGSSAASAASSTMSATPSSASTLSSAVSAGPSAETYPKNVLLRSSLVMGGTGMMVVTAVGDATEIGHVARQATEVTGVKTPLSEQLDRLASLISRVGGIVATASFVLFLGHDMLTNSLWHTTDYLGMADAVLKYFMMAVTLVVMAVPEGLPMAVTLALALNMRRMLKSNNLVRKLQASETMGAVTVICTDKTGTLTENRMTVSGVVTFPPLTPAELWTAIAVNTTAHLDGDKGIGNPTEQALLRWIVQEGADYRALRLCHPVERQVPFSTERKYMLTTAGGADYVKGAPEVVLDMCAPTMTAAVRQAAELQLQEWQRHAMRTLAVARDGRLLAIVAISDPLRSDVPASIRQCGAAGIDVKIVTGDTRETALEIARQTGVLDGEDGRSERQGALAITGAEFAALSDAEALQVAAGLKVMSRARPQDKQRLVSLLQQNGEVVAVTGDGTNDAPALNRAHVGLSLGSGTSVAKQASDITLLDDSFRSIVQAIMWGRSLYKNIQRFIYFQLVVNVAALLLVFFGAFVGTELPLTITQILWVNLIMDTFAAMALASLPPSREVMRERPRRRDAFIISRAMWHGVLGTGGLFFVFSFALLWYFERVAGVDIHELTIFFTVFVMLQWWNLFNARVLGSSHSALRRLWACRGFLAVLAMVLAGQWLIVMLGGRLFRTEPLSWQEWLYIIGGTSAVLWCGELYRSVRRLSSRNKH